jgi:hypothetical protein
MRSEGGRVRQIVLVGRIINDKLLLERAVEYEAAIRASNNAQSSARRMLGCCSIIVESIEQYGYFAPLEHALE